MTAPVPDPAWRARMRGVVAHAGADLAPDVPSVEARVLVELFEPVRRGSARPLDPERPTAPVREHPRSLGAPCPADPVPDVPLNVGVHVVGTGSAGLGDHHKMSLGPLGASACLGGRHEFTTYARRAEA